MPRTPFFQNLDVVTYLNLSTCVDPWGLLVSQPHVLQVFQAGKSEKGGAS